MADEAGKEPAASLGVEVTESEDKEQEAVTVDEGDGGKTKGAQKKKKLNKTTMIIIIVAAIVVVIAITVGIVVAETRRRSPPSQVDVDADPGEGQQPNEDNWKLNNAKPVDPNVVQREGDIPNLPDPSSGAAAWQASQANTANPPPTPDEASATLAQNPDEIMAAFEALQADANADDVLQAALDAPVAARARRLYVPNQKGELLSVSNLFTGPEQQDQTYALTSDGFAAIGAGVLPQFPVTPIGMPRTLSDGLQIFSALPEASPELAINLGLVPQSSRVGYCNLLGNHVKGEGFETGLFRFYHPATSKCYVAVDTARLVNPDGSPNEAHDTPQKYCDARYQDLLKFPRGDGPPEGPGMVPFLDDNQLNTVGPGYPTTLTFVPFNGVDVDAAIAKTKQDYPDPDPGTGVVDGTFIGYCAAGLSIPAGSMKRNAVTTLGPVDTQNDTAV